MEIRNLICIVCPLGCPLTVEMEAGKVISVVGNTCKRGKIYAESECLSPVRMLTTSVKVEGMDMLSVKSDKPLPKENLMKYMGAINSILLIPPIVIGDVIIKNIDNTGVNIIATKNIS